MTKLVERGDDELTDLVENIPFRPFIRPNVRKLGDIREADPRVDVMRQEQRAAIVASARRKATVRKVDFTGVMEATLIDEVYSAFDSFFSDWRGRMNDDDELSLKAIESIDRALAILVGPTTTFGNDGDDDFSPPFSDEDSAFHWLQDSLNGHESEVIAPEEFFDSDGLAREVNHLWLARQFLASKHEALYATLDVEDDVELTPRVYTSSRLEGDLQQLIGDLCEAWLKIDPDIGLPEANDNPDNPLLRYIDACLAVVLGEQRPGKKAVLNFIKTQWKPTHWRKFDEPTLPFEPWGDHEEFAF